MTISVTPNWSGPIGPPPSNQPGIATAGGFVFWIEQDARGLPYIGRSKVSTHAVERTWYQVARVIPPQETLIEALGPVFAIAVNETHIYWIEHQTGHEPTISRALLNGTEVERGIVKPTNGAAALAIDSEHIWWTEWSGTFRNIGRANLDGSEANSSFITVSSPRQDNTAIVSDGTHIYWLTVKSSEFGKPYIGRATVAGGSVEPEWVALTGFFNSIAVDAEFIYLGDSSAGHIAHVPIAGGEPEEPEFVGTLEFIHAFGGKLYYTQGKGLFERTPPSGPSTKVAELVAEQPPYAVDATYAYVRNGNAIERFRLTEPPALSGPVPNGLLSDGTYLYFLTAAVLWRLPTDGSGGEPEIVSEAGVYPLESQSGLAWCLNADTGYLYWNTGEFIGRMKLDGTGYEPKWMSGEVTNLGYALAASATHLFVIRPAFEEIEAVEIVRVPLAGGEPVLEVVVSGTHFPHAEANGGVGIAVAGEKVYWILRIGNAEFQGKVGQALATGKDEEVEQVVLAASPESTLAFTVWRPPIEKKPPILEE